MTYIQAANTPVYRVPNAQKYLVKIGEDIGFIPEKRGLIALYISLMTEHRFSLKTKPMILLETEASDIYTILHSFYLWYSYKSGLPGFDYSAQEKFKKYMSNGTKADVRRLNLDDIESLKEAVKRDQEATDFVLEFAQQIEGSKKVLDGIKNSGSADV